MHLPTEPGTAGAFTTNDKWLRNKLRKYHGSPLFAEMKAKREGGEAPPTT